MRFHDQTRRQALRGAGWKDQTGLLLATTILSGSLASAALAQDTQAEADLAPVTVEGRLERGTTPTSVGISQETIDAEQPQSLKELFRNETAVTVSGGAAAAQGITVHGLDESLLNVTVDGAPQNNSVWHHNGDLTIDPTFLKRAEVYPGVAPADAGFGALGGSVMFETKDAKDMLLPGKAYGGTLITSYDTDSATLNTTLGGYGAYNGFEVLGMVTRRKGSNYDNGRGEEELGTAANMVGGLGKLAYESEEGHRVEMSGEYLVDDEDRRLRPNMGLVNTDMLPNRAERTTVTLSYENTQAEGLIDPEANLYYNLATLERPNANNYTSASGDFNSSIQGIGGKAQNTFHLSPEGLHALDWTTGLDVYREDRFIERFHFPTDVDESEWQAGLYNQLRLSPVEGLNISAGLRLDYQHFNALDGQEFDKVGASPNLSAEWTVVPWATLFAGYSSVWGGIDNSGLAYTHAADYTYDGDIKSARSQNMRAGFRLHHAGFAFETALFRTVVDDPTVFDFANRTITNGDSITSQGVDVGASYTLENARVAVKYTHTDVEMGNRSALPSDFGAAQPVGDLVTLSGQYTIAPLAVTLGGSTEIAMSMNDSNLTDAGFEKIDGYTVFNLFTEWSPEFIAPHVTVRFEANNLFDQDYYTRSTYSPNARVTPVYEQGRSFMLSSTLRF
jgi:hemoglobin/transferrin/lactoferrin receptor protein